MTMPATPPKAPIRNKGWPACTETTTSSSMPGTRLAYQLCLRLPSARTFSVGPKVPPTTMRAFVCAVTH